MDTGFYDYYVARYRHRYRQKFCEEVLYWSAGTGQQHAFLTPNLIYCYISATILRVDV